MPELKLAETGYVSYKDSTGSLIVPWAAVITNPSATQQATSTTVTALFYDASNVLLKSDSTVVTVIFPGQTIAAGSSYVSLPALPTRMEVRLGGTKFQSSKSTSSLTVAGATYVADKYSPKVTAKVTNPFDQDLKQLKIACIVSVGDKFSAIGFSYLELLPAATTGIANRSVDSRMPVAGGSTVRLFAALSSISSVGN
jgi:hypothetical protein